MLGMFTNDEAAKIIGLAPSTLKSYRSRELGPTPTKQGRKIFYSRDALVDWVYEERARDWGGGPNALGWIAVEFADEYKAELAKLIEEAMNEPENVKAMEEEFAEALANLDSDDPDEVAETRELVRKDWEEGFREEFSENGSEFQSEWNERYEETLRERVEADVDAAIDALDD